MTAEQQTQLHQALQSGDRTTAGRILNAYRPSLMRHAKHLCKHRETAEDIVSDAITKAILSKGPAEPGMVKSWLHLILTNTSTDLYRKNARRKALELTDEMAERLTSTTHRRFQQRETLLLGLIQLEEAMAPLDPELKEPILQRLFGATPADNVFAHLSTNANGTRLSRISTWIRTVAS